MYEYVQITQRLFTITFNEYCIYQPKSTFELRGLDGVIELLFFIYFTERTTFIYELYSYDLRF